MLKRIAIGVLTVLLAIGCINEDLPADWNGEGCVEEVDVEFQFTVNERGDDEIAEKVGDIRLYIFDDATGLLVEIIRVSKQQIAEGVRDLQLSDGSYTFVAWGGSNDLTDNGFRLAEAIDDNAQLFGPVAIGETTIDDFRMMIATDAPDESGMARPSVEAFDELFFALAEGVQVSADAALTIPFDFIRNSHTLRVTLTGLDALSSALETRAAGDPPIEVYAAGRNGVYRYDNGIDPYARILRYDSRPVIASENEMTVDIRILRLDKVRHTLDPVWLYVVDTRNGETIAQIDVMKAILRMADDGGTLLYRTQTDIDRQELFEFGIEFEHNTVLGNVTVIVNDWVFGDYTPGEVIPWRPRE